MVRFLFVWFSYPNVWLVWFVLCFTFYPFLQKESNKKHNGEWFSIQSSSSLCYLIHQSRKPEEEEEEEEKEKEVGKKNKKGT
jgi:hypothetical protein